MTFVYTGLEEVIINPTFARPTALTRVSNSDEAYNYFGTTAARVVIDNAEGQGDLVFAPSGAFSFEVDVEDCTGVLDGFSVVNDTDYFKLLNVGTGQLNLSADINAFDVSALSASVLKVAGATADLTLGARGTTIVLNESGQTALAGGFTAVSLLGAINENYAGITALTSGYYRRAAVIDYVDCTAAPPTEVHGDRYILDFTVGVVHPQWDGASTGDIVEFVTTAWVATTPLEGYVAYVDLQNKDALYVDDGVPDWELRNVNTRLHADLTDVTTDQHHAQSHAHSSHTGIGTDDHHAQSHSVASHSDTTATGTQLNTLVGSGDTSLHYHAADRARGVHTGTQLAATISDLQSAIDGNTNVSANTSHRTSSGAQHTYIDQSVVSGSSPSFGTPSITSFASATHNHSNSAGGGTVAITALTAGNWKTFYSSGTGVITELTNGASGYVLKSNGATAAPTWQVDATNTPNINETYDNFGATAAIVTIDNAQGQGDLRFAPTATSSFVIDLAANTLTADGFFTTNGTDNFNLIYKGVNLMDLDADLQNVDLSASVNMTLAAAGVLTLTTPTIGSFVNSAHDHSNAAGGGTIAHSVTTGQGPDDHHPQSHAHSSHTGIGTDDHHPQSHSVASHSDTTATGTQLNTLVAGLNTTLHFHDADRARAVHTGTQVAATISDFDTEVSNNLDVAANTSHRTSSGAQHTYIDQAVTTASSPSFAAATLAGNLTLTGGGSITTTAGGELDLTTTGLIDINAGANLDIDVTGTVTIDATSTFSIDGVGASNVSVTSGDLVLSTITTGELDLTSAGLMDINAGANLDIDVTGAYTLDSTGLISIDAATTIDFSGTNASLTTAGVLNIGSSFTAAGILNTTAGGLSTAWVSNSLSMGHDPSTHVSFIQSGAVAATTLFIQPQGGLTVVGGTGVGSHTLGTGDVVFNGDVEVDGQSYFDGNIFFADNRNMTFGNGNDALLSWRPVQTVDALMLALSTNGHTMIVCELGDQGVNFGAPSYLDPTIRIQSSDATQVNQYGTLQHNQVDFILGSGTLTTKIDSGLKHPVTTVNAATYDLLASDYYVHVTYTATAAVTSLTLPTAQSVSGRTIVIKDAGGNASANNITIDTGGAETIDSSTTFVMTNDHEWVKLYSDGTNWQIVGGSASTYGEMATIDNAVATTINASDERHAVYTSVSAGDVKGFTYEAGSNGVIASIADAGGGSILVTDVLHGLTVGDIITQNGCTDSAYNDIFEVLTTPTADTYTVTAVYTATDTGFWQKGASLTCNVGSGGCYTAQWSASGISATINHVFDFAPCLNTVIETKAKARRKFSNVDYGSFSGCALMSVAEGDKITFVCQNVGASGNVTIRTMDLNLHRL